VLGSYVFCAPEGRPARKRSKIADSRFHDCRHTFASRLAMTPGADLYTVQRAGGWKSQAMVQRYAHLSRLWRAIEAEHFLTGRKASD
jgi:integrase